jgi:hypothetical protein
MTMRPLKIAMLLSVAAVAASVQGCATHGVIPGATSGEVAIATIRISGDTEWRWGRTDATIRQPTPYITRIDGKDTGGTRFQSLSIPAGRRVLLVECLLPATEARDSPRPFEQYENGVGGIFGTEKGGVRAFITFHVELESGRTYDLTCKPIGSMRAQAELN